MPVQSALVQRRGAFAKRKPRYRTDGASRGRRVWFERLEDRCLLAVDLDFSTLFTHDGIRNRPDGVDDLEDTWLDGCCRLVTNSYLQSKVDSSNGLPDDGAFAANAFHPAIQLGYSNEDDGANVVLLPQPNDSVTVDVDVALVTQLHIIALSGDHNSDTQVTLNYDDGQEILRTVVHHWCVSGGPPGPCQNIHPVTDGEISGDAVRYTFLSRIDRWDFGNTPASHAPNEASVFGHRFQVDPQRQLRSVTITKTGSIYGRLVILGATVESAIHLEDFDGNGSETLRFDGGGLVLDLPSTTDNRIVDVEAIDIRGSGDNTLIIDHEAILRISGLSKTLHVRADPGCVVALGSEWEFSGTSFDDGLFVRVLRQGDATLRLAGPFDWSNPSNPLDANGNGSVEPLDALIVLNELAKPRFSDPATGELLDAASLSQYPNVFYDSLPNGFVVALDALLILNYLNAQPATGEGEEVTVPAIFSASGVAQALNPARHDYGYIAAGKLASPPTASIEHVLLSKEAVQFRIENRPLTRRSVAATDELFANLEWLAHEAK